VGDARNIVVTTNLLDLENIDGVLLVTQGEHQKLPAASVGGGPGIDGGEIIHDGSASLRSWGRVDSTVKTGFSFFRRLRRCRPATSRIRATLPSPRMVAAETP